MESFWRWLRAYCNDQIHRIWMNRYGHDRYCPVCHTAYGDSSSWGSIEYTSMNTDLVTCKQCGTTAKWSHDAMLPHVTSIQLSDYANKLIRKGKL